MSLSKTPGMAGYAAHDEGVFIVDLSLDQTMAKRAVVFGGWNQKLPIQWRVKGQAWQVEPGKDLTPAEVIEGFVRDALQGFPQQDEANIAVFGTGSGVGGEWNCQGLLQKLI